MIRAQVCGRTPATMTSDPARRPPAGQLQVRIGRTMRSAKRAVAERAQKGRISSTRSVSTNAAGRSGNGLVVGVERLLQELRFIERAEIHHLHREVHGRTSIPHGLGR